MNTELGLTSCPLLKIVTQRLQGTCALVTLHLQYVTFGIYTQTIYIYMILRRVFTLHEATDHSLQVVDVCSRLRRQVCPSVMSAGRGLGR